MKKFIAEIFFSFRKKEGTAAITSISMQVGSMVLTFVVNLVLARMMLPPEYGAFAYASSLIFVLGNAGAFGTPNLVLKETGAAKDQLPYTKKLLRWAVNRSVVFVLPLLAVFIFISLRFNIFFGQEKMDAFRTPMLVSMACIPVLALLYILQAYLQGRGAIFSALFSEKILKSALFIIAVVILFLAAGRQRLAFGPVAVVNIVTFSIAVLVMFFAIRKQTAGHAASEISNEELNRWKKSARTFFMFTIFSMVYLRADILCLGFLETQPEQIGVYNIPSRVAEAISFPLHVIMFAIAPVIAGLFSANDKVQLQQTVTSAVRAMFLLSAIPAVLFVIFGTPILNLFGEQFDAGYLPMVVLIVGHLVNIIAGPAGYILNMTGHEHLAFISMVAACIANLAFNLILIPGYGIMGAAMGMALGMLVWNALITYFVITKTGIRPDIFYFFRKENL